MSKNFYCNKLDCDVTSCIHNPKNFTNHGEPYDLVHLEDNPLYCTKPNWNGYQVKEEKDGRI
jgi:hypothetical protein